MPIPRSVARFNRRVTNPLQRHWADRLPGFGLLEHTGRTSGRTYSTPLNVVRTSSGFTIVVAYGEHSDWLRNVLAAGGAALTYRGRRYVLTEPHLVRGDAAAAVLPRFGSASGGAFTTTSAPCTSSRSPTAWSWRWARWPRRPCRRSCAGSPRG